MKVIQVIIWSKPRIHSLSCMTHRGGIAAGWQNREMVAGLLLAMPKQFFREEATEARQ